MKLLKHCLILFLLVIAFSIVHSQQRKLSVSFTQPPPISADSGQSEFLYLTLRNVDTGTFTGLYTYAYTINGGGQQIASTGGNSGINYVFENATIASGDSLLDTLVILPNTPQFLAGPSVVVIWPMNGSDNLIAVDTARFTIEIIHNTDTAGSTDTTSTGINEPELVRMYYSDSKIFYESRSGIRLTRVRVIDLLGSIIVDSPVTHEQYMHVPKLPHGLYIVEAILSNNRRIAFKFIPSLH